MTSSEVQELSKDELDAVSGGFLGIIIAAELFAIGFGVGVVACNVANDRPWNEW
jgi:bacteriocin-like protein